MSTVTSDSVCTVMYVRYTVVYYIQTRPLTGHGLLPTDPLDETISRFSITFSEMRIIVNGNVFTITYKRVFLFREVHKKYSYFCLNRCRDVLLF